MQLIDDEGNLFGLVNVVDALVVLLVLAIVTAGAAFALQPGPDPADPERESTYATLDLGTQPDYLIAELNEGDTYDVTETSNLTITDVRLEPRQDGTDTRALVRVELTGEPTTTDDAETPSLAYDGAPPRLGRELQIVTDTYQVSGRIVDVGADASLSTAEREVLLETTVDADTAASIQEGDQFALRERTLGTVDHVEVYGTTEPGHTRVLLGATLHVRETGGGAEFAGTELRQGATVPFRTTTYNVTGEVARIGATEPRGQPATRAVTLSLEDAPPEMANAIRPGMTESVNGDVLAEVTDVQREPASVLVTTGDGDVYEREHPRNETVTLTADLSVRETETGPTFKGEPFQYGSTVTLDLGGVTIEVRVSSL